jgi:hypothetical protein
MTKPLKIMEPAFVTYHQKPVKGVFVNTHHNFVKVSPADYSGEFTLEGKTVQKRRVYDAIVEAGVEAREKKLAKIFLPLGAHTHIVTFDSVATSPGFNARINVILDLSKASVKLDALEKLKSDTGLTRFILGRVPFHNNTVSDALYEAVVMEKHSRISSVFARKRDGYPRVYVTMAFSDVLFGLRSNANIDLF